jgi:hypothetical protein
MLCNYVREIIWQIRTMLLEIRGNGRGHYRVNLVEQLFWAIWGGNTLLSVSGNERAPLCNRQLLLKPGQYLRQLFQEITILPTVDMCSWKDGKFNGNFLDNARWKPLCPAASASILHTEFPIKWLGITTDLFCILNSLNIQKKNNFYKL